MKKLLVIATMLTSILGPCAGAQSPPTAAPPSVPPSTATAQADSTSLPSLPADVPTEFDAVGPIAWISQAAQVCGFRGYAWGHAIAKDVGTATDSFLAQDFPNGVPDNVKIDAIGYIAEMMKAGRAINTGMCSMIKTSGYLAEGDAAAANASQN